MTANLGTLDRLIRLVLGIVLILLPALGMTGANAVVTYGAYFVGAVLVATAAIRFCPLYRLFGIRTCQA